MQFNYAIVRRPCPELVNGLTSATLGKPVYEKALVQHREYVRALSSCGLEVLELEPLPEYPDSTFIEDVALCTSKCAVITNPGAPSRNGERRGMDAVLRTFYNRIEFIEDPGTLEAGDVMMVGNHFYIGISRRTNHEGADQLIRILNKYHFTGSKIELKRMLHLKSGVSYLENNHFLVTGEFINHPDLVGYKSIETDVSEQYAANSLWVNGRVLVPAGFPGTATKIGEAGFKTEAVDLSEFQKLDGGMSCLSLRF